MGAVLDVIRNAISTDGAPLAFPTNLAPVPQPVQEERLFLVDDDLSWDYQDEPVFDDVGEGAGIEGDLEAEED